MTCPFPVPLCSLKDRSSCQLPIIDLKLNNFEIPCLIDSGAAINLISIDVLENFTDLIRESCSLEVQGISDSPHSINEKCTLSGRFGTETLPLDFFITPLPLSQNYKAIISFKFLKSHDMIIDTSNLVLRNSKIEIPFKNLNNPSPKPLAECSPVTVRLAQKLILKPYSEKIVYLQLPENSFPLNTTVLAESAVSYQSYAVSRSVSNISPSNTLPVKVLNLTAAPVHLNKNTALVSVQPVFVRQPPTPCASAELTNTFENDFEAWGGGDVDLSHLCGEERQAVEELLHRYPRLFATSVKDLEGCDTIHHRINLRDSIPVRQKPYKVPYHLREEMDKQISELLEANIIEESDSPYSAPVLFVRKSDGSYRLVTDFRKLNEKTIEDNFPLPNMTELIDNLSGAEYFTSLDLTSGYFQMPVHPDDVYKCAFSTYSGHYCRKTE